MVTNVNVNGAFLRIVILIESQRAPFKVSHGRSVFLKVSVFLWDFYGEPSKLIDSNFILQRNDSNQQDTLLFACGVLYNVLWKKVSLIKIIERIIGLKKMILFRRKSFILVGLKEIWSRDYLTVKFIVTYFVLQYDCGVDQIEQLVTEKFSCHIFRVNEWRLGHSVDQNDVFIEVLYHRPGFGGIVGHYGYGQFAFTKFRLSTNFHQLSSPNDMSWTHHQLLLLIIKLPLYCCILVFHVFQLHNYLQVFPFV